MFRTLIVFIAGVYIGQEYGDTIPSVKVKSYEMYESLKSTEFYKKIRDDLNKEL
jgi:hypothetical protein